MPPAPAAEAVEPVPLDGTDTDSLLKSWTGAPPVSFIQNGIKVNQLASEAQQKEKGDLKESFPEIEQPTGIPPKKTPGAEETGQQLAAGKAAAPELQLQGGAASLPKPAPVKVSKTPVNNVPIPKGLDTRGQEQEDEGSWWDRLVGKISSFLGKLKTKDDSVDTDPGTAPKVPLEGESDPGQNEKNKEEANASVDTEKSRSDEATKQDFGEHDVYPEVEPQMMTPGVEPTPPPAPGEGGLEELPPIDPQTRSFIQHRGKSKNG